MEPIDGTRPPLDSPLDWFLKVPPADLFEALAEDSSLLADIRDEIKRRLLPAALGATGAYPEGKLGDDDEGQLSLGIVAKDGQVRIFFGKKISWFALPPPAALGLAQAIMTTAHAAQGGRPQ